jgi:hypothetical protein
MRIKIGKLRILILWGDPLDGLKRDYEKAVKHHETIKKLRDDVQKRIDEENELPYIKEVKEYLRQGRKLEAVKACLKERMNGLRDARDECDRIEEKMKIDAKNK